jgi:hypothetical protein
MSRTGAIRTLANRHPREPNDIEKGLDQAIRDAHRAGRLPSGFLWSFQAEAKLTKFKREMQQIFGFEAPDPPKRNARERQVRRRHRRRSPRRVIG